MKKTVACIIIVLLLLVQFCIPSYALDRINGELSLSAHSYSLLCCNNNELICSSGGDEQLPMASTTKIMTAIVAIENNSPADLVTVSEEACGIEGSSVYLYAGEKMLMIDLLYALMLESANDAACAIAIYTAGNIEAFVDMMNDKADVLNLHNTHFDNPHGLYSKGHYSSSNDLAILMSYAMENNLFAEITGTYKYSTQPVTAGQIRTFVNHNRLLKSVDEVCGGKTGYTTVSGRCLVSYAEKDGVRLCAVTLNAPDDWQDHKSLYVHGFSAVKRVVLDGIKISFPVINGVESSVVGIADSDEIILTDKASDPLVCRIECDRFYYAGINEGEILGYLVYTCNNDELTRIEIKAKYSVSEIKYKNIFQKLLSFFIRN